MKKINGSLISYMSNLVKTNGGINCAQGIPGFAPPNDLLKELEIAVKGKYHQYAPGLGYNELRSLIAENTPGLKMDNILITNGATEAIALIYLYIKKYYGPELNVLGFDPVYESYTNLPRIYNDRFLGFDSVNNIQIAKLKRTIENEKIKLIFIASPGNPFGRIFSEEEVEEIIYFCNLYDCFLIFDAVYKDIYFDEPPYLPLSMTNKNIFFVSAFSKMLSITGWRIGYLHAHKDHFPKLSDIHDYTGLCAPSIFQKAIYQYLNKYNYGKDYIHYLRKKIRISCEIMHRELSDIGFNIPETHGGYFVWAELPDPYNDGLDFALKLYESKKLAIVPGIHFSHRGKRFIRINIARPSEEIYEASKRIRSFIA